jgi:SAM-dependent methyltransferase
MVEQLHKKIVYQRGARKSYNILKGFDLIGLESLKDKSVLEVACGKGMLSVYLSYYAKEVTGVDIFESEITEANKLKLEHGRTNCNFIASDIFQTSLEKESFDIIVAEAALHHLIYDFRIGEKLWEYLKPGGRLIFISEPLSYNFFNELNRFIRHWRKHMFGEFQLWYEHIADFGKKFEKINYYYFDLFSQPFKFIEKLMPKKIFLFVFKAFWRFDEFLIKHFKFLRKYSPNVNIEFIKGK